MDLPPGPAHTAPPRPDPARSTRAPAGVAPGGSAEPIESTIARVWALRRRAEKRSFAARPALGVFVALGFIVIAKPDLLPGGSATALAALAAVTAVALVGIIISARRASFRGHSGSVEAPAPPRSHWWRSPALAAPAVYSLAFVGNLVGAFDYLPVVIGCAVAVGLVASIALPGYETADHIHGARLEKPPTMTDDAVAAVADGALAQDVLELLVLQHHTVERRISWCADVLGTDTADIRGRMARGRRWLELPATEVHDPATATWVRLTADGREALGYA